jgi:polysaccharide biosynthesis transport protein
MVANKYFGFKRMQQSGDTKQAPALQFQQVLDILYRRGRLILKVAALGTVLSGLASLMISPKFTATALILIGQDRGDGTRSASAQGVDETTIDTHVSMLMTLDHLKRVQESFHKQPLTKASSPEKPDGVRSADISPVSLEELERRLRVNQERRSRIIALRFTTSNPDQAAAVVNRAAQIYVEDQDERSRTLSDRSISWVGERDPEFKNEIERARATVQKYRAANDLDADVRVLSLALPPDRPSSSSRWLFVTLGGLLSAVGTALMVVILDHLDRRLYSKQQVIEALHIPCSGVVPHTGFIADSRPCQLILSDPFSAYAEAIRSVVAKTLRLEAPAEAPKVILVTSSLRGEGKTTLAVSMAAYAALLGRRVLLMDLDCRNPSTLRDIEGRDDPEVLEHLMSGARIDNAVQRIHEFGFDYVPSPRGMVWQGHHGHQEPDVRSGHNMSNGAAAVGDANGHAGVQWGWPAEAPAPKDPVALFTDERLKLLLNKLRETYDCVIIDGPPLLMVTEGRLLAAMADTVLFAVEWGATKSDAAQDALAQITDPPGLQSTKFPEISAVLSKIDPAQYAAISYGVDPKADRGFRQMTQIAMPALVRPNEATVGFEPTAKTAFDAAASKG